MQLVRNEWMKIWRRPATIVMIGILVLAVAAIGVFTKYQENGLTVPDNENWKHGLELENKGYKEQLKDEGMPEESVNYYKQQIALNEYRINHNISTNTDYSAWDFISDCSQIISLAALFTIIIAAGIVANEFNWGTIKLLLIRPIGRTKILLSKYITIITFGLFLLIVLFFVSFLLGVVLFGLPKESYPYLTYSNGTVKEVNMIVHLIVEYGFNSINMLMLSTMAFMISTVFRNSSLAIGVSLFLMFMGSTATMLLASRFEWAKYILFANTDLLRYFDGVPMVSGMTMTFSVIMLIIYFCLFHILAFLVFNKRDVAA